MDPVLPFDGGPHPADEAPPAVTPVRLTAPQHPCAHCGAPITMTVPRALQTFGVEPGGSPERLRAEFTMFEGWGDPTLCLACRPDSVPPEDAPALKERYRRLQAQAAAAGMPDAPMRWPLFFSADDAGPNVHWHGFRGRILAAQVAGVPSAPDLHVLRVHPTDGGPPLEFLVYETAVWHERIPAALVFPSRPDRGSDQPFHVRGWQHVAHRRDLERLMRGVEVYQAFKSLGGRPAGGPFLNAAEFAMVLKAAIDGLRAQGRPVTQEAVAAHFSDTPPLPRIDARQLRRWISAYFHCPWTTIRGWTEADWDQLIHSGSPTQ